MNTNVDDLQRAIDDITNSTNQDPVFQDTVAAPAPARPVAPAAESLPNIGTMPAADFATEPPAGSAMESASIPEPALPDLGDMPPVAAVSETAVVEPIIEAPAAPAIDVVETVESNNAPVEPAGAPILETATSPAPAEATTDTTTEAPAELASLSAEPNLTPDLAPVAAEAIVETAAPVTVDDIKAAALEDLTPLLDTITPILGDANIKPSTKFKLYRKIITELGDKDAINSAYDTAKQIPDDAERGEALLSLVEVIDQM